METIARDGGVVMLEWLGLIPLLGLTGEWRGYRMGGKAVGGVMAADMKGKFEQARAAGNMDQAKAMADKAHAEKPEKQKGKGKGAAAAEAKEAKEFSSLIDKNRDAFVSMTPKEIEALKGLNEKMSPKEIDKIVLALSNTDNSTFGRYIDGVHKVNGNTDSVGGVWNEFFRQATKIPTAKRSSDVDTVLDDVVKRSKSAGAVLQRVDPAIAKAASKDVNASPGLKADPVGFFRRQGEFYEKTAPIIVKRIADIRKKQLAVGERIEAEKERAYQAQKKAAAQAQKKAAASKPSSKSKPVEDDGDFNIDNWL
jgi:hypothetical protein